MREGERSAHLANKFDEGRTVTTFQGKGQRGRWNTSPACGPLDREGSSSLHRASHPWYCGHPDYGHQKCLNIAQYPLGGKIAPYVRNTAHVKAPLGE